MRAVLKKLRAVQLVMLGSILIYAVVGEVVRPVARAVDPSLSYVFTTAALAIVGMIFVVRRTLILRSAENLALHPDDSLTLNHWKAGYFATYALCEGLALLGMVLRFLGFHFQQCLAFYVGGFVLLLILGPRAPVSTPTT
jgi:hypothetical protein